MDGRTDNVKQYNPPQTKFAGGIKTLLHQGLLEPEFYGDLVYKLQKI